MKKKTIEEKAIYAYTPPRKSDDPKYLKQKMNEIRTPAYRRMIEGKNSPKRHRFYLLPEHQRVAAMNFFDELCQRHKDRILIKPRFINVLHMIVLNRFKNPEQNFAAGRLTLYKKLVRARLDCIARAAAEGRVAYAKKSPKSTIKPQRSAFLPL